jgi:hypothetical protein
MGSKYSDSHAENIGRFYTIIHRCNGFGAAYNPSNPQLSIVNMTLQLETVKQLDDEYGVAYIATKNPINDRQELIAELVKRIRRVKNAVLCSEASDAFKRDVKALSDKFTGDKVRRKKNKEGKPIKKRRSNSHLDVASRMGTLESLLELLRIEPSYAPNEPILKMTALDDALARMENLTDAVDSANAIAALKRIERDKGLYMEDDGLVDVSLMCKKYVRAVFGARSPEAKEVSAIKLKRFMRIKK